MHSRLLAVGVRLLAALTVLPMVAKAQDREVVVRADPSGRLAVRAVRVSAVAFDGALDDAVYRDTPPYTDFVQQEPNEGAPATEKTEVWIFYDQGNLYVAARIHESEPERRVATDMQRDAMNMYNNDHLAVIFDTFGDHRNGFGFSSNRLGGMFDWTATNEQPSSNWNGLWQAKAKDFPGGWTLEMKIPFRSIRYRAGTGEWGVNIRRMVRWKNEMDFLTVVPRSWGRRALNKISDAARLEGIAAPPRGLNLDVKPYALGSSVTNLAAKPVVQNRLAGNRGADAKWALGDQLVTDFTWNTDFAQVEDDQAQVNLTRFSLFFPERREFFLEGQEAFGFAGVGGGGGGAGGGGGTSSFGAPGQNPNDNLSPILFYSRRIGLTNSGPVPIIGGARMLGRSGPWQVGTLSMQTQATTDGSTPSTNFSVLRVNRDVFSRSRIGMIATRRDPANGQRASDNLTVGADAQINLTDDVQITTYVARTNTAGRTGNQSSHRARFDWNGDRYALNLEQSFVGEDFNPEVGFMRRSAFRRAYAMARFSPRPRHVPGVRKFSWQASADHITGARGGLQTEEFRGAFVTEFNTGDFLAAEVTKNFEQITIPFEVARNVRVPRGGYHFAQGRLSYQVAPQRRVNGTVTLTRGAFYDGTLTEASWRGRVAFTPQLFAEPSISYNRVAGPFGSGDANVIGSRLTYTITPRLFVAALTQYQSRTSSVATNARLRWEYQPGSELFIVYSDGRSTIDPQNRIPALETRSVIVKLTKLFRW